MKKQKRKINGVLLLDKSVGVSSNTALQQIRHLFCAQKAGHTGILDPLASGLLPICFGEATKFAQYLLDADKAYIATLHLGMATTTGDAEGEPCAIGHINISALEFQHACMALTGIIQQIPPMFSALKYAGKPLYEYARKGIVVERKMREVMIQHIDIKNFNLPNAVIEVSCSKGTYIRTLAEDIAKQLGTVAHLTALRRIKTAGFEIEQSHSLEKLTQLEAHQRDALLLPCDILLQHIYAITLNEVEVIKLRYGQRCQYADMGHQIMRAYTEDGEFIGLVCWQQGQLSALRFMSTQSLSV